MHYLVVSFSHKNSTLSVRERLAFTQNGDQIEAMSALKLSNLISEIMILSTCNRVEIFCTCSDTEKTLKHIINFLAGRSNISENELAERADVFDDKGCLYHLFSVASSLDSLVVGETQIAGQLKDAYKLSFEHGFCNEKLSRAMLYANRCAAEIRNLTNISSKPVSVASVAVSKAKERVQSLEGKNVLVIGSGEMSIITVKHLTNHGANVTMMNRTLEKITDVALEYGASILSMDKLEEALNHFDLLFTATSSLTPIITAGMIQHQAFRRYWFDMAVPRDIDDVRELYDIDLFYVDDLKEIVTQNIALREEEAKTSFVIVRRHVISFFEALQTISLEPLLKQIYLSAKEASIYESKRVIEKGFISKEYDLAIQKATEQALKRFLHPLSERLRQGSEEVSFDAMISAMNFLFNIDDEQFSQKNNFNSKGN